MPSSNGWQGTWTRPNGSGALAVTLNKELDAARYAEISRTDVPAVEADALECTIKIYRHRKMAEVIDGSVDGESGCGHSMSDFPDLNFDGHADMIVNIDTPAHNTSYDLLLYDEATKKFINAGMLTEPQVDPLHENIVVSIHYSCCEHSVAIYRIKNNQPSLIREMQPCSTREPKDRPKGNACFENYFYDFKTGKIVGANE